MINYNILSTSRIFADYGNHLRVNWVLRKMSIFICNHQNLLRLSLINKIK